MNRLFTFIHLLIVYTFISAFYFTNAQTGIYHPDMQNTDDLITDFMNDQGIQGGTVALARNGKLVYLRAFGKADQVGQEITQPYHLFRIASVSKPVTSIAIMKLWEEGLINFDDKIFGEGGILNSDPYFNGANITDTRIYNITMRHLLEHSAGWNRDIPMTPNPLPPYPYGFASSDPIGFPLHVTLTLGEDNPVSERALIKFLLERGLDANPGSNYYYSNIGYLILGAIIEHVTGMSYEDYVKTHILDPLGSYDMHIGKNLLIDKMEREGEYLSNFTTLSCYGTGQYVPWQYGGFNFEAMDAHGGWVASAKDLLRLILAVDRFSTKPDILSAATIDTMTAPSSTNANYAKGWQVNQFNNWWHTGSLDGTRSIMVRAANGFAWVFILNEGGNSSFWTEFDDLIWNCISSTTSFPSYDLMNSPLLPASDINFTNAAGNSITVQWNNGSGEKRLLLMRADNPTNKFPLDGTTYNADNNFGSGDDLGEGNYVAYAGDGNSVTITNLSPTETYHFRLFEYNQNSSTGDNALYLLAKSPVDSTNTTTSVNEESVPHQFSLSQNYPNPFNPSTSIEYSVGSNEYVTLKIYDVLGNEVATLVNEEKSAGSYEIKFDGHSEEGQNLTSGIYFYQLKATPIGGQAGNLKETKKMILLQ